MRNRLERRRLTLRAAALCIVLVLLCGCLPPAFAEGPERTDSVPDQTWDEEIEDEPAGDEEEDIRTDEPVLLPAEGGIPVVVARRHRAARRDADSGQRGRQSGRAF